MLVGPFLRPPNRYHAETMTSRAVLSPLFSDITLSADDATAIVAALHDVAQSDGKHADEIEMIREFTEALDADLGERAATELPPMTPEKLAATISDPEVRRVVIQCSILLAWADGAFSSEERQCIERYATALGISADDYAGIEATITGWVQSGDAAPLF